MVAAEAALPARRVLLGEERGRLLVKIAGLIDANSERLVRAESQNNDELLAAANFHFFGTAAAYFVVEAHVREGVALNYTVRHPMGVVACISPCNLSLYLFS